MLDWWDLPGPAAFVQEVCRDLVAGVSVVAAFPDYAPDGFRRSLRRLLPVSDGLAFENVRLDSQSRRSPLVYLYSLFLPDDTSTRCTVDALSQCPELSSRVVWLEGIPDATWPQWREFLEDYQRCAHAAIGNCPVFCVLLTGVLASSKIVIQTPCMRLHRWSNRVSFLDMLLYVSDRVPPNTLTPLQREIAVSVIANLALWDPAVADLLLR